ncbi:unnamed protein product, partial [Scytosiphon promiscuus]
PAPILALPEWGHNGCSGRNNPDVSRRRNGSASRGPCQHERHFRKASLRRDHHIPYCNEGTASSRGGRRSIMACRIFRGRGCPHSFA